MRHSKSLYFPTKRVQFSIPDLIKDCPFELNFNPHGILAGVQSDNWISEQSNFSTNRRYNLRGLKCGLLAAMTYPDAPAPELRTCCDFLSFLFHIDDLSDDMDGGGTLSTRKAVIGSFFDTSREADTTVGRIGRDIWQRFSATASAGAKARFISTFELFFRAVSQQAIDRREGRVMDLETYMVLRRDTSGCKPCWACIEYANGLDIPDEVMGHETIEIMGEATNDIVSWSNDIFSFKVEDARHDNHNMISIAMRTIGLSLQDAVDYVGDLCQESTHRFIAAKKRVPSFDDGGPIDKQVAIYIKGLEDWIVGSLHWSFESSRYFGKDGKGIKNSRVIKLQRSSTESIFRSSGPWSRMMCLTGVDI
ncbi:terpenoid synthase [Pyrrhoderma noxium]|uniref:Terpene synthase n=1 Tax=Pyrrhoderma noxium TaxID=2282107 RepID=A0A286U6C6_9AGAM|nr:terpenoid synthase [Pyrrhoderma noxium]